MDITYHLNYKKNNYTKSLIMRVCFVTLAFFLSLNAYSKIHISILDTGFCPNLLDKKKLNNNIKINDVIDLTSSVKLDCNPQKIESDLRFHGHKVLKTFLENLATDENIEITPYIIFDKMASQSPTYWKNAFSEDIQNKTNIYLVAAGLPYLKIDELLRGVKIKKPVFVASGVEGVWIKKEHKLWPQELSKDSRLITIIGDHYPRTKYDTEYVDKRIKYLSDIKFFFSHKGEDSSFTGSSYAVALALARAISLCPVDTNFLSCLKKKSSKIKWEESFEGYTF